MLGKIPDDACRVEGTELTYDAGDPAWMVSATVVFYDAAGEVVQSNDLKWPPVEPMTLDDFTDGVRNLNNLTAAKVAAKEG
jgi:hypothetical protein